MTLDAAHTVRLWSDPLHGAGIPSGSEIWTQPDVGPEVGA